MTRLAFRIEAHASGSAARAARFQTLHGEIKTPLFMPVGTQATVKAQRPQSLEDAGSQILLANTYHLLQRPGVEVFKALGGYHGFSSWQRSVLTDSGGFQLFSLSDSIRMSEEGATFRSHIDGRKIFLSPEVSIDTQKAIGSDIMMVLDQCIPSISDKKAALEALGITYRWAKRSLDRRAESKQALFGIVQGALFHDLRRQSAEEITSLELDGFAIGGLAVGEGKNEREDICEFTAALLPQNKPRYLMGVGTPLDILEAVHRGVDMFDCIIPTQVAQYGTVFTSQGVVRITRTIYKFAEEALDPDCACPTCSRFSRAYLHHLIKSKEPLSWQLLGQHNIFFYHKLMSDIRESILEDRFLALYEEKRTLLSASDPNYPPGPSPKPKLKRGTLGDYEVHHQNHGFASIRHKPSGEIMHSSNSPMEEANSLYIEQSGLAKSLLHPRTMVVWDVGLGAASNAMAAVHCYESAVKKSQSKDIPSQLHIISFENDLDSLRLALRNNRDFTYLRHPGPASILKSHSWISKTHPGLSWTLCHGDFQKSLQDIQNRHSDIPTPDIIFFDMFSNQSTPNEWSFASFQRLYSICHNHSTELFTYSRSTAIRAALLAAGFYVAAGTSTGNKGETTIARTNIESLPNEPKRSLLGKKWLGRWQRSTAQFPEAMPQEEKEEYAKKILGHPQFQMFL